MKIDYHDGKKLVPLKDVYFGSVVFIEGKYYLVIDNYNYLNEDTDDVVTVADIETGTKHDFDKKLRVEIVNARMVVD